MRIKQKKWNNSTTFNFEDDHFIYQVEDESKGVKKRFSYLDLPSTSEFYETTEKNILFLIGAITFLVVGLAQYFIFLVWKDQTKLSTAAVSVVFYIVFRLTKTQYTAIPTENGTVSIIKDKLHEKIIDELYSHSRENELRKFKWLLEEEIITVKEYELAEALLFSDNHASNS